MWGSNPEFMKIMVEAHVEELRRDGSRWGRPTRLGSWLRGRRQRDAPPYSGQKPSTVSPSPLGSSIRTDTITSSASSGSSFQTPRVTCARNAHRLASLKLDDLVLELELELAGDHEVELLLRLVPMPV